MNTSRIHNAVYDAAIEDGESRDAATREAEKAIKALEGENKAELKMQRKAARQRWWNLHGEETITLIVVLAVLTGLSFFGLWLFNVSTHNDKDYAGYGPKRVAEHAVGAFHSYYGDRLTPNVVVTSGQVRSVVNGHKAWRLTVSGNGQTACVYVWDGVRNNYQDIVAGSYKVIPDATCKGL